MNIEKLNHAIESGIQSGDWRPLEQWSLEEDGLHFDDTFGYLLTLMKKSEFLDADGSHKVLLMLEYEIDALSAGQKSDLIEALTNAYPNFKDWLSWFVTAELLGRYLSSDASLVSLVRLQQVSSEQARSLIPMGLDLIIRSGTSPRLSEHAYSELIKMQTDPSQMVRDEVELSLKRVSKSKSE